MPTDDWQLKLGSHWGPVELGMGYQSVLAKLQAAKLDVAHDDDRTWMDIEDPEVELLFDANEPHPLLQIASDDLEFAIDGKTIIGETLPRALNLCNAGPHDETVWRIDGDPSESLFLDDDEDAQPSTAPRVPDDELLLIEGTLWLRRVGVGLVLTDGLVHELVLRKPDRAPRTGYGSLTPVQLQLARHSDLAKTLQAFERRRRSKASRYRRVATFLMFVAVACIGWLSFQDEKRWHQAPVVDGTVVAIEDADNPHKRETYVVDYHDSTGAAHQVRWTLADLYVPPMVGATVEVRYLEEAPDKPIGPMQLRNMGFFNYVPYILLVMGIYAVALMFDRSGRDWRES